ncbi:hypothetical protein [Streptomyces sp. NPDC020917]|uniref:hypothetical protein n=1 Tax=Streptomyces sp. NPDC020917 TaxID=3365102 RepID=UPI0037BE18E4
MVRRAWQWLTGVVVAGLGLGTAVPSIAAPGGTDPGGSTSADPTPITDPQYKPAACASLTAAQRSAEVPVARCFAVALAAAAGRNLTPDAAPPITAISPAVLQQAYHLPDGGDGMTGAIVDAYGYSSAEADLAVYRSYYGLRACTTANGCLTKIDQRGGTDYPPDDSGWSVETALDLDAVSSVCPKCNILLVQGDTAGLDDLGTAVDTAAARPGVVAISNSYGLDGEDPGVAAFDRSYDHLRRRAPGESALRGPGPFAGDGSGSPAVPAVAGAGPPKVRQHGPAARHHLALWLVQRVLRPYDQSRA